MSIYDYRTIVPAKTKIHWEPKATPKPEISMAEDAKACNAKMGGIFSGLVRATSRAKARTTMPSE